MKELWGIIKRARSGHLLELMALCFNNIRLVWPTYRATKLAVSQANTHFGRSHQRNTPANAFRHALWNWLIAKTCAEVQGDENQVLAWTERITDMHEKIMSGNVLANTMDLHNNAVGRWYFRKDPHLNLEGGIRLFLELTVSSRKVKTLEEIRQTAKTQYVHLINPES